MSNSSTEKSWKEIGETIGAAVDLASYVHSKLSDSKPTKYSVRARTVQRPARERKDPWYVLPLSTMFVVGVVALGIAAVLWLPKPTPAPMRRVCEFAPAAA